MSFRTQKLFNDVCDVLAPYFVDIETGHQMSFTIEISNNKVIAVRQEVRVSANEAREEWVVRELWKKKYVTNERSFREKEPQKTK